MNFARIALAGMTLSAAVALAEETPERDAQLIESLPIRIREPGPYRLSSNLDYPAARGAAISIEADHVTVDLNGHTLSGSAGAQSLARGIHARNRTHLIITNGRIEGFYFGVDLRDDATENAPPSSSHLVSNVCFKGNWYFGVRVMGTDCEIRNCQIHDTGGCTRADHTIPHAARLVGERNAMRDCRICNLSLTRFPNGKGEVVGVHFDAARDSVFERNQVIERIDDSEAASKQAGDETERRFGLWINGGPENDTMLTVRDNTFSGFSVPIVFAPGADGSAVRNEFHAAADTPIRGSPTGTVSENRSRIEPLKDDCSDPCPQEAQANQD